MAKKTRVEEQSQQGQEIVKESYEKTLELYEKFREVPPEAIKPIVGGRLKGKSDINPMWRIKVLTEVFGPCGKGWKYEIVRFWLEKGCSEVSAFCHINLFYKIDNEVWSEPIPGVGGASFITQEKESLYQSDECFKMALTDALSVSCKALGVAANVYFEKDSSKYSQTFEQHEQPNGCYTGAQLKQAIMEMNGCNNRDQINALWNKYAVLRNNEEFRNITQKMCEKYPS